MTLRVGILGPGGIAARHAEAVRKLPDRMTLVTACGRDRERTGVFADRFGISAHTDCAGMIERENLDLLIVALPPFAHDGQVELAARNGVNLLVEKPIALDLGRAEAMVEASRGVVAACGFMYRFGSAVTLWDRMVAAGETGPVGHFSGSFHCNSLHADWWRERDKAGGQMVEQLIHIVDLARHNLGMPQTVYARAANLFHRDVPRYDTEDVSAMILGYNDGRIGVLHASNAFVPGRWTKGWQVLAERASGIFSDFNTAELVTTTGTVTAQSIDAPRDVFVAQLEDVADAIAIGRPPAVPLSDGLDSLKIVLAARRSADEGREVSL